MTKRIWIITMFPDFFKPLREVGVVGQVFQGIRGEKFELNTVFLPEYSNKGFKGVDESPYGGGPGMVMRADVLKNALLEGVVRPGKYNEKNFRDELSVIFTAPRGVVWDSSTCKKFANDYLQKSSKKDLVFICGRYEGVDERFLSRYVDEVYCIGDFVLSGGEIAVMAIIDSSFRFSEGVLGNDQSAECDSFEYNLLEHPQYTRPSDFEGMKVPPVLLSGDHKKIEIWKEEMQVEMTTKWRLDLLEKDK